MIDGRFGRKSRATPIIILLCLVLAGCYLLFIHLGDLLSASDQVEKADVLLCLTGSQERLEKCEELLRSGVAEKLVATTEDARKAFVKDGVLPDRILHTDWSADSTFQEGELAVEVLAGRGYRRIVVVTDPYHIFRTKWTVRHLFAGQDVELFFVASDAVTDPRWWENSQCRLAVLTELPKILYYWVWHGLLAQTDDPAWVKDLGKRYAKLVGKYFG